MKIEGQKIVNLLDDADNDSSKFATRNGENNTDYGEENESGKTVKLEAKAIKSGLCDYFGAYILVTGDITATAGDANTR